MRAGDTGRGSGGWRAWAPWALVALAAILPYLNTLGCGFAFDDGVILLENPTLAHDAPWWRGLVVGFWPDRPENGLYRPVTALSFRLQRGSEQDAAFAFHGLNLLLHVAVCLLGYGLLRRMLEPRHGLALAIAAIFAVHPIHTEAVTYIQGRGELLAALAGLAGYFRWLFGRRRCDPVAIGLLFAIAAGSKESAVGWGLLLAAHRVGLLGDGRSYRSLRAQGKGTLRHALARDTAAALGFAAYLLARRLVLGSLMGLGEVSAIDNPLFAAPWTTRVLSALVIAARGLGLLLWPARLSADYSFDAIPLTQRLLSPGGFLALALVAGIVLIFRARRRAPLAVWSVAAWGSLLLPVSNLLFPIGTIMAERLWYLPSLGALTFLVWAAQAAVTRLRATRAGIAIVLVIALLLAARTVARNRDWTDDRTLFRAAVATQPRSVKAHANLASRLMTTGTPAELAEAERHYRAARAIAPDYLPVLNGLGYLYTRQRSYDAARALLQEAITKQAGHPEAWVRLGNLELEVGRGAEALAAFEGALRAAPEQAEAWIGKASALFLLARYDASADAWIEAQRRAGPGMDLRAHAAAACQRAGRIGAAEALLRERVAEHPGDPSAVSALLRFLLAQGNCDAARDLLSSSAVLALGPISGAALADSVNAACR